MTNTFNTAAYGGKGWQQRIQTHSAEIGTLWQACGIANEFDPLQSVILYRPGQELIAANDNPDSVQMLQAIDLAQAQDEHDQLKGNYQDHGVTVNELMVNEHSSPNLMFCADLFAMTPMGAILARPASTVRAGEEVCMASNLARLNIPIIKTILDQGTFEGADLMWVNAKTALLGIGHRTNKNAAFQIARLLEECDVSLTLVDMPFGTMHLMGMLRIVASDLAIAWPRRTPHAAVTLLQEHGYQVVFIEENAETESNKAFNFVTLGPRKILMVDDNPQTKAFYESHQIECICTPATELSKAAGAVGCLTGVIQRKAN